MYERFDGVLLSSDDEPTESSTGLPRDHADAVDERAGRVPAFPPFALSFCPEYWP